MDGNSTQSTVSSSSAGEQLCQNEISSFLLKRAYLCHGSPEHCSDSISFFFLCKDVKVLGDVPRSHKFHLVNHVLLYRYCTITLPCLEVIFLTQPSSSCAAAFKVQLNPDVSSIGSLLRRSSSSFSQQLEIVFPGRLHPSDERRRPTAATSIIHRRLTLALV